jgi:hypothetical protein
MRSYVFYLAVMLLTFGFCSQTINAQDEINTKPLINKWLKEGKIQEGIISLKTLEKLKKDDDFEDLAKVSLIDLNGDEKKELAVQTPCVAVGNCELEIYIKTSRSYKTLLLGSMIQDIKILKTKTKGFYDLKLGTHNSASSHYYQLFKFNGKEYLAQKCWWEDYTYLDSKGKLHELKKPIIHVEKCGEYDYVN